MWHRRLSTSPPKTQNLLFRNCYLKFWFCWNLNSMNRTAYEHWTHICYNSLVFFFFSLLWIEWRFIAIELNTNQVSNSNDEWEIIIIEKGCLIESIAFWKWLIVCSYIVDLALDSHTKKLHNAFLMLRALINW